ncbi:MAG: 2-hydroxyacyl-CoA dehydratase family protein, partial [Sphingomonas sp.]
MTDAAARLLIAACDDPGSVAAQLRGEGRRVVRVLGQDAPYALLRAAGLSPVRMVPRPGPTPDADALAGDGTLSHRGRSLLQQIVAEDSGDPILFTHADSELPQLFATVRELLRTADIPPRPIHFLDLLHLPRASSRTYNLGRIAALGDWLEEIGGSPFDPDRLRQRAEEERGRAAILSGLVGHLRIAAIAAAHALDPGSWHAALGGLNAMCEGDPAFVLGSPHFSTARTRELEASGLLAVGDDQDWGDPLVAAWTASPVAIEDLADPARLVPRMLVPAPDRLDHVIRRMDELGVRRAAIVESAGDEAAAWDAGYFERELVARGFAVDRIGSAPPPAENPASRPAQPGGRRSRKSLASIGNFGTFQRDWFKGLRDQVASGAPLALVNANSPQEILRAMGVPFVVNQWWASIVAAK